jgi:C1A family cysteine protease
MPSKIAGAYLVERNTGKKIKIGGIIPSETKPDNARKYVASRFNADDLPSQIDLRPYMTKVEDQSAINSCVANAFVGAYEYLAKRQLGDSADVSRLFVYYNARSVDGIENKDVGCRVSSAIKILSQLGACSEETWGYDINLVNQKPHDNAYEEAQNFLVEEADDIDIELNSMKSCLAEGYPFVFCLKLFKSFDHARKKGIVPLPDFSTETGRTSHGNHAMLAVGYLDSHQVFIVRNSWGEDWGDRGYCYIPYDYMTNPDLCWDCWAIRNVSDLDFSGDISPDNDDNFFSYFTDLFDNDDEDDDEDGYDYEEEEDDDDDEYIGEYEDDEDDEYEDDEYEDDEYEDDEYEDDDEDDEYEDDDDDDEYEDDDEDDEDDEDDD